MEECKREKGGREGGRVVEEETEERWSGREREKEEWECLNASLHIHTHTHSLLTHTYVPLGSTSMPAYTPLGTLTQSR